jgi:protein TonB
MDTKRTVPLFAFVCLVTHLSLFPVTAAARMLPGLPPKGDQNTADPSSTGANKALGPVTPPKLIHSVEPKVPKEVYKRGLRNTIVVDVRLSIQKDGTPTDIHIDQVIQTGKNNVVPLDPSSDPLVQDLAKSAIDAVSQYRFKPAKQNGEPVGVFLNVTVKFTP